MTDISLVQLKAIARELLPEKSTLRFLILAEPDNLSAEVAKAKVDLYVKLFYEEIKKGVIKCTACGGTVRVMVDGRAYCEKCGRAYL